MYNEGYHVQIDVQMYTCADRCTSVHMYRQWRISCTYSQQGNNDCENKEHSVRPEWNRAPHLCRLSLPYLSVRLNGALSGHISLEHSHIQWAVVGDNGTDWLGNGMVPTWYQINNVCQSGRARWPHLVPMPHQFIVYTLCSQQTTHLRPQMQQTLTTRCN